MKIDNLNQNHSIESQDLERKINLLRSKLDNNQAYFICEQDIIGLKIEKYLNLIIMIFTKFFLQKMEIFLIK